MIVIRVVQQVADIVYEACTVYTPIDRMFCLPQREHTTCSSKHEHTYSFHRFIQCCLNETSQTNTSTLLVQLLKHITCEDSILVARCLHMNRRAVVQGNVSTFALCVLLSFILIYTKG